MFGMFAKKVKAMGMEAKKFDKRDLMQACIAMAVLVAFADGELESSEEQSLRAQLNANPAFAGFGSELETTISQYIGYMKVNKYSGKQKLLKEIGDVKTSPEEAMEVFCVGLGIAEADGEIEPAEKKTLKEVGAKLGVNLSDFWLGLALPQSSQWSSPTHRMSCD